MIQGYFLGRAERRRPFSKRSSSSQLSGTAALKWSCSWTPALTAPSWRPRMLCDQREGLILIPARRARVWGAKQDTRTVETVITLDAFSLQNFYLTILEPPPGPIPSIPSLLGRDILFHFGLFLVQRDERLFLLDPNEADAVGLP